MNLLKSLDLLEEWSHFTKLTSPQPSTPSIPTKLSRKLKHSSTKRRMTSSSQTEDGNAVSARTTTSREERNATDAKNLRPKMTAKACQLTWPCLPHKELNSKRKVSLRKILKTPNLKKLMSRSLAVHLKPQLPPRRSRRELVTGHAKDASTTTLPSEMCATCATWATSKAIKCFTDNRAKDTSKFKTSNLLLLKSHNNNIKHSKCKCQWCNLKPLPWAWWAATPQHGPQSSVTNEKY